MSEQNQKANEVIGLANVSHDALPLIFGIYPGGAAGNETGVVAGPPDDPIRIQEALDQLQGKQRSFIVRTYMQYMGVEQEASVTPNAAEQYVRNGRRLDLVLCFRKPDLEGWPRFINSIVERYGPYLAKLQITEEPNLTTIPAVDGCIPHVREALIQGVITAKDAARRYSYDIQIGFNAVISFDPQDDFWPTIATTSDAAFQAALDYVGMDFFPDVFRPIEPDRLHDMVVGALTHFRQSMSIGNIATTVPLHINENGWATGQERPYERQAAVLETVVRAVHEQRAALNITHYEHFDLRDADSSSPSLFYQFGLLRDDYTPKPAFEVYRQLIAELGG
ncbi:hypothetical protein KSF_077030 [Reticulibacter mediterranei]|uniref:Uncharacterized protein n=1 Tax=Reticulibacter mediterranei TaxID=2778369 RepID=A0A8J3ISD9_9CHLR|nr:hypothetical protein [Reticulibacter mediterranei]GHO97655.1 hypothetical protein KSF_077030 [Reticulibacter mediterranei]